MSASRLRYLLIALLAVAAVLSVVGSKTGSHAVGALSVAAFLGAVVLYANWRRQVAARRRGRVFDREAKTSETRTRTDE
jgi:hypothetical protein